MNSFYPDLDWAAREALALIGGATEIVVLSSSVNMSGSNEALTMTSEMQVESYRGGVESAAQKLGIDGDAIMARIMLNTILIKEHTVRAGGIQLHGVLWHEYGHVLHGPAENGLVFSHELDTLRRIHGDQVAREWCLQRGLGYFASFCVDPGKAKLEEILSALLSTEQYAEFQQKCLNAPPTLSGKSTLPSSSPIAVGDVIEGTIREIKARIGKAALTAKFLASPVAGKTAKFAEISWDVLQADVAGDHYQLRRRA
ncbi:hypothetical protein G5C60_34390 [Streptomyces sp. HC44]|uniref:Uncharacterized protein n=1 Tax=Streptomyces scabichelini TaxID=2711217 RepID=A0A6G4VF90_9ACTN|nr:hypothetical protein [Streptomyces scabichelini]NGO12565.1 hypothetical protein [Streptomyces scabichelini]